MPLIEKDVYVDKPHVEQRVKDWQKRVADLYQNIDNWLKGSEYNLKINSSIKFEMYEELMHRFGVAPVKMDIASIYKGQQFVGKIAPFGLWIIGANGAIELNTVIRTHKIVDVAENFAPPTWNIVEREGFEEHLKPFNKASLLVILRAEDIKIR